ncbi:ribonuclease HII [Miltoncostaea marina]|uniref:ribonuclease HII n=1 Tax=Miltoncostaea marina TaxID=2843215 RepID=UPI001C3C8A32|nr:ribonuclease HII [Miltoncostaea marina]
MGARRRPGQHRPSARLFAHDRGFGERRVAGADEAGRGCLAGPLVVAAVCLDLEALTPSGRRALGDLDDSKRLPHPVRERVAAAVMRHAQQVVVLSASAATIDRDGLHRTNLRLLARALSALRPCPTICLVDGFRLGPAAPPHRAVVGGDGRSAAIAAASVIAKTARDRLMTGPAHAAYPAFGFGDHVGYATSEHHAALRAEGLSPLHRRSFRSAAYPGAPLAFPGPGEDAPPLAGASAG